MDQETGKSYTSKNSTSPWLNYLKDSHKTPPVYLNGDQYFGLSHPTTRSYIRELDGFEGLVLLDCEDVVEGEGGDDVEELFLERMEEIKGDVDRSGEVGLIRVLSMVTQGKSLKVIRNRLEIY